MARGNNSPTFLAGRISIVGYCAAFCVVAPEFDSQVLPQILLLTSFLVSV